MKKTKSFIFHYTDNHKQMIQNKYMIFFKKRILFFDIDDENMAYSFPIMNPFLIYHLKETNKKICIIVKTNILFISLLLWENYFDFDPEPDRDLDQCFTSKYFLKKFHYRNHYNYFDP